MDVRIFWEIIKKLNETVNIKEMEETIKKSNNKDQDSYINIHKKYTTTLKEHCSTNNDIRIFIAIYEKYYELLFQKCYNENLDKNTIIKMEKVNYHVFISFLITLGIDVIKKLYNSPSKEITSILNTYNYKQNHSDFQIFINNLKKEEIGLNVDEQGRYFYKEFELTYELEKEIENTL